MISKAGALGLAFCVAIVVAGVASARTPTPAQKAAITAALRSEQGDVAIQKILVSSVDPGYASLKWGYSLGRLSAYHTSLVGLSRGTWKVIWTRDLQQPADGACIYAPAPVAHDLYHVTCPPAAKLRARAATAAELGLIVHGFRTSDVTPYAKTATGLTHVCISNASPVWAAGVANFTSGGTVYVFFRHSRSWSPVFESLLQQGASPPANVVLSLASCVGYNPADYDA